MTAHASMTPPHDYGVVGVIDGQSFKITPFRTANIPPPMALHELEVPSNAIDVAFNADASLIAVLHRKGIAILEWKSVVAPFSPPLLTGQVTFEKNGSPEALYSQISFADQDEVLVLERGMSEASLKRYRFSDDTSRMEEIPSKASSYSNISALSGFYQGGSMHPFVQGKAGDLHSLTVAELSLSHCNFPLYLSWTEIAPYGEDHIAFGMSGNGHLYANSRLLAKNCTSFLVTPAHLIFTTTTHLLKFVHIADADGNLFLLHLPDNCANFG
jgi:elongator complex protein 1